MVVELKMTLQDDGRIAITGPIDNEMVCYFLLEKGRQVIAEHHATKAARLVQPATQLPPLLHRD